MDQQDQSKLHAPGHESHGVHVCHKCGWPFPNPHPSARHRRAHKKICGTVEGYPLSQSEENPHGNVSDDEHLSDEDHKGPGPKVAESSHNWKGIGEFGERSNRSEDDLFSDAAAEFSETGTNSGVQEPVEDVRDPVRNVEKVSKHDLNVSQSSKDDGIADVSHPASISVDGNQMGNPADPEHTTNQMGSTPQPQDNVPSSIISSMASSVSESITEESVGFSHDRKVSPGDTHAIEPESLTDKLQRDEETNFGEDITKSSMACAVQEVGAKGTLDGNLRDSMVSPSESVETVPKLEEKVETASDFVPAGQAFESVEELGDSSGSKVSQNDLPPEVDPAAYVSTFTDNSQVKVDALQEINHASSGNMSDSGNSKEKGNDNLDVLAVHDDSANHADASIDASQIKVGPAEGIPHDDPCNIMGRKEEENADVNIISVPDETPKSDPPAKLVEDFGESKVVRLQESVTPDSCAKVVDKEDIAEYSASEDNSSSFKSRQLNEGMESPLSDTLEGSSERDGGRSKDVVNEVLVDEEVDLSQTKVRIDEVEVVTPNIEEEHIIWSREEQGTKDICNNEIKVDFPENDVKFSPDAGFDQATIPLTGDDAGNCEKAGSVGFDVTEDNNGIDAAEENSTNFLKPTSVLAGEDNNGIDATEENSTNISKPTSLLAGDLSESLVVSTPDLPQSDEAGVHEKGKVEKCKEDDLSVESKLNYESTSNLLEFQTVADDITDRSVHKLSEDECMHLDGVSYSSGVGNNSIPGRTVKEDELSGNGKVEVESLGVSAGNESYHSEDIKSLQPTVDDQTGIESHVSALETKSSVRSSDAVEEKHGREFDVGASGITSESSQGDRNFVQQQAVASAVDVSVGSLSQTSSLEGHWGSVSVLSIQSDAAGVIDGEAMPSSESLATDAEKPKAAPEGQHSDNMFEAPSFMTLVEPLNGRDQKDGAPVIQTGQSLQQHSESLQAGWFPSLTNVVNESQGRKKNEEIVAKVTNWSTGKQHTPLKSLLGEASLESKSKSKKPREPPAPAVGKDGAVPKDNGAIVTTVNSILDPKSPSSLAAQAETNKEWNSPAKYHSEIKREKRKVKGRPYWVQFVCCTSIN